MKKLIILSFLICFISGALFAQQPKTVSLNGTWDFGQTVSALEQPVFNQNIPVPGLVHLADPKIQEYEKFFKRPQTTATKMEHSVYQIDYTPRYSWYRKKIFVAADMKDLEVMLNIKKSQYVTQIYINGVDMGDFMQCYTPINVQITRAIKYGQENEIIIKVGDRYWLPAAAAGGTDKEKEHYLPGIWDDVSLNFTDKIHVTNVLMLPHLKDKKVTAKLRLWNLNHAQVFFGEQMTDICYVNIKITEKKSHKVVASLLNQRVITRRDRNNEVQFEINMDDAHAWSPDDPFLYMAEVSVNYGNHLSDQASKQFGMRDFERRGKFFYLNGKKLYLRGTNVTLQRFFEDPDCHNLAWDTTWVKKMLIDIPKKLDWNAMRICVGIAPDFWYDLADENGLLFQNEWFYWQNHGWNDELKKEYTDWVWADGSHPSIAIWDAINENNDEYIGNDLIPELKKLDPTRVWDAGFMTSTAMNNDEMDEPHPYMGADIVLNPTHVSRYPLGELSYRPAIIKTAEESPSAQLVNEYGWVWLWRDGTPSKLTLPLYNAYLGTSSTVEQRRNFQAYWLQLETEWLRSNKNLAGVLAFCYLTNNYGYTGDWFTGDIKDLNPSVTMYWFRHCFAPTNVFINLADERYINPITPHVPGQVLKFNCIGVNDISEPVNGKLAVKMIDANGKVVSSNKLKVALPASDRRDIPVQINLPKTAGGYLLETEFTKEGKAAKTVISRRYIQVGREKPLAFYELPVKP